MATWLRYILIVVIGYLLGNISAGILISKLFGVRDIRKHGSGNAGSTNVLRTLGWVPSLLSLLGDCAKGYIAAQIGRALGGDIGLLLGGLSAVLGHDYPVFFKFKGGKGIATSWGLILAINPLIGLIEILVVIIIVALTHMVSVASITAAVLFPVLLGFMRAGQPYQLWYMITAVIVALLAIFCHRANIDRLIQNKENRLDFDKISKITSKIKGFNEKRKEKK